MRSLTLWEQYTREEVHGIFSPETTFTPQAGTWGLQGIVRVPDTTADFVFFVTFGSSTGSHEFAEEITEDGVLTWQSQPKQKLTDQAIEQFIAHNDLTSTIHLFLRTNSRDSYTYFGPLGYLSHEPTREQPVHFTWQLMEWPAPAQSLQTAGVTTVQVEANSAIDQTPTVGGLEKVDPPEAPNRACARLPGLSKQAVLSGTDAGNAELGLAGELLVLAAERESLSRSGRTDLADQVVHVAVAEGDSAGYDIRSFELDGTTKHIEVKTTRGSKSRAFFISPNELRFSDDHPETYVLMRLFRYDDKPARARCYEIRGPVRDHFELTATEYRAQIKAT